MALRLDPALKQARKRLAWSYIGKKQFLKGLTEWFASSR